MKSFQNQKGLTIKVIKSFCGTISRTIEDYSSDSMNYKGVDYFKKTGHGKWKLRDNHPFQFSIKNHNVVPKDQKPFIFYDDGIERIAIINDLIFFEGYELSDEILFGKTSTIKIEIELDFIKIEFTDQYGKVCEVGNSYSDSLYMELKEVLNQ